MNYEVQAVEILSSFGNYRTVKDIIAAHNTEKANAIKELTPQYIYHGGETSLLIFDCDKDERIGEPLVVKSISKKLIVECIASALEQGIKTFEILTDSQVYYHETLKDKFQGVEPEPSDKYFGVSIVKYSSK